jgi:hypothetical protein
MGLTSESGGVLIARPRSSLEAPMKIRVTKKGEHAVILMHSGWPEGTILTVSKGDGDAFIREGNGELVTDEEVKEEPAPDEEKPEPEPETATAEPSGETTMRPAARRRQRGA